MAAEQRPGSLPRAGMGIYTETLARLYTQQGFVAQALDIYRHLAQAQPRNRHWRERIVELEQLQAGATATPDEAQATGAVPTGPAPRQAHAQRVLERLEQWLRVLRQQRLA